MAVSSWPAAHARRAWRLLRGAPVLLALTLALIGAANAWWISHNAGYIQDEVASHLDGAADFRNRAWGILAHEKSLTLVATDLLDLLNSRSGGSIGWPRATYAVSALVSLIAGDDERWPFLSNFVFFVISLAGFLVVMRRLFPDSGRTAVESGLLAAALWSLFPGTYGPLRLYGLDFPLACCMMPGLGLLMASEGFSDRKMSVAFGVFSAFAILVKGQFLLYMAPALFLAAVFAIQDMRHGRGAGPWQRLSHAAMAAIAPMLAIWLWLHGSFVEVGRLFYIMVLPGAVDPAVDAIRAPPKPFDWFSVPWLTYWIRASIANLGIMGTLALSMSPLLLTSKRGRRLLGRDGWLLLGTTLGIVIVWTVIPARDMRFVFPFLPVFAAVAAMSLMAFKAFPRNVIVVVLLTLGTILAARMSVDRKHHAAGADRIHRLLGWDAGHIMARPVSPDPFPGLADLVDQQLDTLTPGRPSRIALIAIPYADGRSLFDHYNEQVRIEAFRLKCRRRSVAWRENAFLHPRTYRHLGSVDTLDPRYLPPTYFDREGRELDMLIVCHFFDQYEYVEPPYRSWAYPGFIPELFTARTAQEIEDLVPGDFHLTRRLLFDGPDLPAARVDLFVNARPGS